ncbi:MAG: flagellar assembly peptidoglycan hydrolase FlgJ [Rhodoferax sp.]|nr:flagellar assembly peptidoglycan hydrolase FlgJ [Rhodoferax sp.]
MSYTSSISNPLANRQGLAADARSLGALKMEAGKNSPEAIKETAKQFESLFMRELMKSMREATMKSGMLDSPGENLGTDLLDQQFAVQMSGQPGGLSDLIAQQLTRQMGGNPADATSGKGTQGIMVRATSNGKPPAVGIKGMRPPTEGQSKFVQKHAQVANEIEKKSGIPASYMLGQAGHETGWGKFEIKQKGGAPSHNLFGIKAGANWTGKVAEVTTTEFINGAPQRRVARFRAYDSYAEGFKDYARLISESPRYAKAREQLGSPQAFANGLQKAGYATDPEYAAKLARAINTTLAIRAADA